MVLTSRTYAPGGGNTGNAAITLEHDDGATQGAAQIKQVIEANGRTYSPEVLFYDAPATSDLYFRLRDVPLWLEGEAVDFTTDAEPGMLAYLSATSKFRAYDSSWKNVALEDWVSANTISHPQVMSRVALRA